MTSQNHDGWGMAGSPNSSEAFIGGFGLGALAGAGVGTIVDNRTHSDLWQEVTLKP